jgi:DNA-directed RNA polymerase subunit RPC12/RpoP
MRSENSRTRGTSEKTKRKLALVRAADDGQLDSLECPDCGHHSVSVWFTHPREDEYRTWYVCSHCPLRLRGHDLTRPRFFSEERVDPEFNEYDDHILRRAIFKRPKPGS